jgi:hypothetical protein
MADLKSIDFGSYPALPYWTEVRGPLFEILATIRNRIDRDLRAELEARANGICTWLLTHVRVVQETWELIEEVAALAKQGSLSLRKSVTIPPLARVPVDSVFSTTFVLENPGERLPWFWKSTWREIAEEHDELAAEYGNDPAWKAWLDHLAVQRDSWRDLLAKQSTPLTAIELADPTKVKYWPNPGKMPRLCTDPERARTLDYLNVRFYGNLSGASHLSGTGILAQGGILLDDDDIDFKKKYFSDQVLTALTAMFALVTTLVLDVERTPALARRVQGLWETKNLWAIATETYDRCFRSRLEHLAS